MTDGTYRGQRGQVEPPRAVQPLPRPAGDGPAADRALIERAARAGFYAFSHDVAPEGQVTWEQVPEEMRVTFRMVADAVLMAADLER